MKAATRQVPVLAGALLALTFGGCSGCGESLDVDNVAPEGSVGGLIVDAVTRLPVEGANVRLLAGAQIFEAVATGADGAFAFEGVPAGEVLITIEAPAGYRGAWIRDMLSNAAGEFPTENATLTVGPIGLVPTSETFTLRVLDQHGKPVSQYPLTLRHYAEYVDFSDGMPLEQGEVVMQASTDTSGYATFADLPDFYGLGPSISDTVIVLLPPLDADTDGVFEFAGGDRNFYMRDLADPTPDVILDSGYTTQLQIRASTIPELAGAGATNPAATVLSINDVIHAAFNLPIENSVEITVSDEYGTPITQLPSISVTGDNLAINFGGDPLLPGNEYNLHIHAVAAVGERLVTGDFYAPFFTPGISEEVTVANIARSGNRVELEFSEPIGVGNGTASTLNGANCVLFINYDIDGSGLVGDGPMELTNASCDLGSPYYLRSAEPDPVGPGGASGYTKYWIFDVPQAPGPVDLPQGTHVHILFSHVSNAGKIVERATGVQVEDFTQGTQVSLPVP